MSKGCTNSTRAYLNDYYYNHQNDHSYYRSDVSRNVSHDCKNSAETSCTYGCPKPCCEGRWPLEDWNWAVVNSYKYLFISEKRLTCNYDALLNKLHYGYKCDKDAEDTIDRVKAARDTIKREIKRYKYKVKCLCTQELKSLFELIERFEKCETAATNVQIQTDENWVKQNLLCASREDWEMYSTALCALFKLSITISSQQDCAIGVTLDKQEEENCDIISTVDKGTTDCDVSANVGVTETDCEIAAELSVEDIKCNIAFEITKNQLFCDFIIALSIIKHACDMGLHFEMSKEQCKIEWNLIVEKNPECNIDLKTYILCKELGMTYDLVQLIINAGLDLQTKNGELFILGLLQEYRFNSLSFSGVPAETDETKQFYSNPKAFVEKYLKDYNLSALTIQKILNK